LTKENNVANNRGHWAKAEGENFVI
jgi:hypothetical protein